ncbi:response regulator [Sediminibacterium soli]|uniref:response regulator n=1 Tax=Sediminibacterium soli TaxID=2698829 RepID=UPI00137A4CE3|nr:response regulator [Sediminibacterium soli]NCI45869.1 response regulator [Sediminibacterium soli]
MPQKILLVDDREDNLFSLETILEADGYHFVKASSGRQALKILLNEFDFALILMDVKMPNLNGFETAALIYEREKLKHIPIIFITANNYGEENIFKGYRSGAVDYIFKPVNPELLRAKVSVFVELYKKNHQLLSQEEKLRSINKNLENEIKERKLSEEKVNELNKKLLVNIESLETANKELDRFAFMASHDMQEPLRKIRTFSDLLAIKHKAQLDEDAQSKIRIIQKAAERMQELIKDILTFSKISTEKEPFVRTEFNPLVQEVLDELDTQIQNKDARIDVGPLPVLAVNPVLIKSLFLNLVGNAIKYSKPNVPPEIHIYCDNLNAAPKRGQTHYYRIFIKDNGIGFNQKYAEQIFDMFKRLHVHNEYEGTGIGLALCKQIMEKHNGYINAVSAENEGATFIISLPAREEVAAAAEVG